MPRRLPLRPPTLVLAAIGLAALAGATVRAAPASGPATVSAAPTPPPSQPLPGPRGAGESKPRMWAVGLSSMVVYENGSGYLYGTWRQFGAAVEQPARLYWGRGCPDISDRVYHVLQTGFSRPQDFWLIVDREPDPRQQGAFCVRNVELEAKNVALPPAPLATPAPAQAPAPAKPAAPPGK
jgi:hypothetical protein